MSDPADEKLWRRRFLLFTLVRIGGFAVFLLGLAISATDLVREGGFPILGFIVSACGIVDAVLAPILLRRIWERS